MATSAVDGVVVITGVGAHLSLSRTIQLIVRPFRLPEGLGGKLRFPLPRPEQLLSSSRISMRKKLSRRRKKADNSLLIPNTASLPSLSM